MHELRRRFLLTTFKFFDVFIMIAMFVIAASVVYLQNNTITMDEFFHMRLKVENYALFLSLIFLWHIIFSSFGLYYSKRLSATNDEIKDLVKATTLGTLAIHISAVIFNIIMITPFFLIVFWTGVSIAAVFTRLVLRNILKRLRLRGHNLRYILIAGTNERARKFARIIESKPELGCRLIGFVDEKWVGNGDLKKYGWTLISDFKDFNTYISQNVVDEVVIALPIKSYYWEASQILSACEEQGITVRNLSGIFNPRLARLETDYIEGTPIISHYTGRLNGWPVAIKRVVDLVLAVVLLIILSPFFLVAALVIKLDSPGPVLFVQKRVGLNKRRFRFYKFRTMFNGAEQKQADLEAFNEVSGPVFKIQNDPRITTVGKILRKTSIDEWPQLINVLRGDMSLVGPRPLPVRDYNGFDQDWHRRRFSVRPGITCLWQVNGRSSLQFDKWMDLDLQYIDKWTLWLDFKILVQTVPAIIRGSGAA